MTCRPSRLSLVMQIRFLWRPVSGSRKQQMRQADCMTLTTVLHIIWLFFQVLLYGVTAAGDLSVFKSNFFLSICLCFHLFSYDNERTIQRESHYVCFWKLNNANIWFTPSLFCSFSCWPKLGYHPTQVMYYPSAAKLDLNVHALSVHRGIKQMNI